MRTSDLEKNFEQFDSLELSQIESSQVEGGDWRVGVGLWLLNEWADFNMAYQAAQSKCCK